VIIGLRAVRQSTAGECGKKNPAADDATDCNRAKT
jgi:hypothetical protein